MKFDERISEVISEGVNLKDSYYKISDGVNGIKEWYAGEGETPKAVAEFIKAFDKMDKEMKFGKTL